MEDKQIGGFYAHSDRITGSRTKNEIVIAGFRL